MDQAIVNARQTSAFARRVVCRALTVLGGVAAGTAIAWWLSTASASAETELPQMPEVPAVTEVATPVSAAVDGQLKELHDRVRDAAAEFGKRAKENFDQLPSCEQSVPGCDLDLTDLNRAVPLPPAGTDDGGRADTVPASGPTAPAAPPVAVGPATAVALDAITDSSAQDRALADGMSRRGSPAPVAPLPTWPAPFAPTVPGTPATGHSSQTGNSIDPALFVALPWRHSGCDLVAGGTSPATEVAVSGRPDAQPGVKPD